MAASTATAATAVDLFIERELKDLTQAQRNRRVSILCRRLNEFRKIAVRRRPDLARFSTCDFVTLLHHFVQSECELPRISGGQMDQATAIALLAMRAREVKDQQQLGRALMLACVVGDIRRRASAKRNASRARGGRVFDHADVVLEYERLEQEGVPKRDRVDKVARAFQTQKRSTPGSGKSNIRKILRKAKKL